MDLREMSIYERIDAAYAEISQASFTKDGTVKVSGNNGYRFISIGQILEPVRKAHGKWGVKVFFGAPEYDAEKGEKRYAQSRRTQYGETTWQIAQGHIHVRILGRDEDDCIELDVPFEAQDNSDKLTNKILTNAERCLYRTLYAIDEGDASDPEAVNIPAESIREEKRERAQNDRFFGNNPKEPAHTHTESTPVNGEAPSTPVEGMTFDDTLPTAKDLAEATFGESTITKATYTKALAYARKWISAHPEDEFVKSEVKRFGSENIRDWPKSHVVDIANLQLEAEGRDQLGYDLPRKEVEE